MRPKSAVDSHHQLEPPGKPPLQTLELSPQQQIYISVNSMHKRDARLASWVCKVTQ